MRRGKVIGHVVVIVVVVVVLDTKIAKSGDVRTWESLSILNKYVKFGEKNWLQYA